MSKDLVFAVPNAMLAFDAPRAFINHADNGGSTVRATLGVKLDASLIASLEPADPKPGEVQYLVLKAVAPDLAALEARVTALEAVLAAASSDATPGTLVMRDSHGGASISQISAEMLRPLVAGGSISMQTTGGHKAVEVKDDPAGNYAALGFYGATPLVNRPFVDKDGGTTEDKVQSVYSAGELIGLFQPA